MPAAVTSLLATLDLEPLEHNLFRGHSPQVGWQRVFGGQVIAQALSAATRTVPAERPAHSLHGYFLRPGDPEVPIIFEVDRIRDGKSFTTRRVVAIQHGHAIFSMSVSYHVEETGLDHQTDAPQAPPPEALMSDEELQRLIMTVGTEPVKAYWRRERAIELRPVSLKHYTSRQKLEPIQQVWFRATGSLPDDPAVHKSVLAYASDLLLLDTSLYPHGRSLFDSDLQVASLDHALWFHRDFRADEWLLYAQDSPSASGSRGFNRGAIFTREGVLVASVAQEGLIRVWPGKPS
jgi:acyl-CoA thioesterase-2